MASIVDIQKIAGGQLPSQGKVFIGLFGDNEPETNPIAIFSDVNATVSVNNTAGVLLDLDGYPTVDGQRISLYSIQNYSLQIRDKFGAKFWPDARQIELLSADKFIESNPQIGTEYTVITGDLGRTIVITNAAPITLTVNAGISAGATGFNFTIKQGGAGIITWGGTATLFQADGHTGTRGIGTYATFMSDEVIDSYGIAGQTQ